MVLFAVALAFLTPAQSAETATAPPTATTNTSRLSAEQKAAVDSLDVMLAGFDALFAKITDVDLKAATKLFLDGVKERRDALRKNFDQNFYNDLRLDIYHEYQRTALWLQPLRTPPRPGVASVADSDSSQAGQKALRAVEWQIKDLEARASRRPAGPSRDLEQRALKSINERYEALGRNFTKAGYDALLAELQALTEKRRPETAEVDRRESK
ncbi:MAG: hypothetical protein ACREH8_02120 [Opitutaceae bacterium]